MNAYAKQGVGATVFPSLRLISVYFQMLSVALLRKLLDACYLVSRKPHEQRPVRGSAVNPVFNIVAIGVALAHFVSGLANRRYHHLAIHANLGNALLNCFP